MSKTDEFNVAHKRMNFIGLVGVIAFPGIIALATLAQAQKPQTVPPKPQVAPQRPAMPSSLPGRVPMWNGLLPCSPQWEVYYDVAPEGERRLYFTVSEGLLPAVRECVTNIRDLDQRLKKLEKMAVTSFDPNKPADPNGRK